MRTERIKIREINCDGPHMNVTLENSVLTFADSVANSRPIIVYEGSQKRGYKYTLACGFHRVAAAEHVGIEEIMAVIVPWSQNVNNLIVPNVVIQ